MAGMNQWWPLAALRLKTPRLELRYATSSAFIDNLSSQAVSRKLGYADDGIERLVSRGQPATMRRLRLDRET